MLSYELWVIFLRTSTVWASILLCLIDPASSILLLVMDPVGLANKDKSRQIQSGNCCYHKIGISLMSVGTKCTPLMPVAAASHAPFVAGWWSGMISAIRVGRDTKFFASHRKSSKKLYSVGERRSQFLDSSSCRKASQRMGNKPVQPEIANDMDLNSPMILCHSFLAIERWVWGIESSISPSRVPRCSGRHIVC